MSIVKVSITSNQRTHRIAVVEAAASTTLCTSCPRAIAALARARRSRAVAATYSRGGGRLEMKDITDSMTCLVLDGRNSARGMLDEMVGYLR